MHLTLWLKIPHSPWHLRACFSAFKLARLKMKDSRYWKTGQYHLQRNSCSCISLVSPFLLYLWTDILKCSSCCKSFKPIFGSIFKITPTTCLPDRRLDFLSDICLHYWMYFIGGIYSEKGHFRGKILIHLIPEHHSFVSIWSFSITALQALVQLLCVVFQKMRNLFASKKTRLRRECDVFRIQQKISNLYMYSRFVRSTSHCRLRFNVCLTCI